jgi:phytoene synthase
VDLTTGLDGTDARAAVRYCEDVTKRRARNFWYGIRLLPAPKRHALAAVYAMSRRIDDIGDGSMPEPDKRRALDQVQASLDAISPDSLDRVLAALGVASRQFPLPVSAFVDLIDGVRMDLDGERYRTFSDLERYCRRVAGSVGRLSLAVFGARRPSEDAALADDLGVAMQLTNVLRDIREDLDRGRVYLPEEDLAEFGAAASDLRGPSNPRTAALIRFEAFRARDWFGRGLRLLRDLDRRSAACAGAMAGIYVRLLHRIEDSPGTVLERRLSLPAWEKGWVAARALAGGVG